MIYLDVDGVIADFEAGLKVLGWTGDLYNRGRGELSKFMYEQWERIFSTAPLTPNADYFMTLYETENQIQNNCQILTAMGSHYTPKQAHTVYANKLAWLEKQGFEREHINIVPTAEDILPFCKPGAVLYDDKRWTIKRWNELGGLGILVYCDHSWNQPDQHCQIFLLKLRTC